MTRLTIDHQLDDGELADLLSPRDDIIREQADGPGTYSLAEGPVAHYQRTVTVETVPLGPGQTNGLHRAVETIEYEARIPYWGPLLALPLRSAIRRHRRQDARQPIWAPPQRLDYRAARVLASLAMVAVLSGFLGNTQGEMLTYAATEFDVDNFAQGISSAITRVGSVLALGAAIIADRRGRRLVLGVAMVAGIISSSLVALAPNFATLTALLTVTRTANSAIVAAAFLLAMEEMPSGSRAFSLAILAMPAGLGAGMVVWVEPLADLSVRAWRFVFVVPLLLLPFVMGILKRLPESRRFESRSKSVRIAPYWRRIVLLGIIIFLINMFLSPIDQFRNEYLREEHGLNASRVSLLVLTTATPGSLALLVAGRLADTIGRRIVIATSVIFGLGSIVWFYNAPTALLWPIGFAGVLLSVGLLSSLGVYRAELFPTNTRARAGAMVSVIGVCGSVIGLLLTGWLSDRWDSFGPAIALLWFAPLIGLIGVILGLRETSRRELESLNPEDAVSVNEGSATNP